MRAKRAFTLIELLISVAIITVGMIFVLGALGRSVSALATADRTIRANELLNGQIWTLDADGRQVKPSIPVNASGTFDAPYEGFRWARATHDISIDFDHKWVKSRRELSAEETVSVSWDQSRRTQSVSLTRFVPKRVEGLP
jgi:prepilin-type N-terminal cleavage/methylation domain-containing protein